MSNCRLTWKSGCIGALAAASVALVGCGESERPTTIPVTGRVTLNGQPPGESGKIYFAPIEPAAGYPKRGATGTFKPDGSYRVMSWVVDDGLVPGHYLVRVMPSDPANTKIPERYGEGGTNELEVDVPADQDQFELNFDLVTN